MNHISLTDISGNKLYPDPKNNLLPFIILSTEHPIIFLNKNKFHDNIYNLKYSIITDVLSYYNINPYSFTTLGDIWNSGKFSNNFPILLVNTSNKISKYPVDFVKIDTVGENNDCGIWKPIDSSPNSFIPLSLIASRNKPSIFISRLVNKKYIKDISLDKFNFLSSQFKNVKNKIHPTYTIQGEFITDDISDDSFSMIMPLDKNDNFQNITSSNIWNNLQNIRGKRVVLYENTDPWYKKTETDDKNEEIINITKDDKSGDKSNDKSNDKYNDKYNDKCNKLNFFLIFLLIIAAIFIISKILSYLDRSKK